MYPTDDPEFENIEVLIDQSFIEKSTHIEFWQEWLRNFLYSASRKGPTMIPKPWSERDKKEPMIELGPYLESVRAFLMGETAFPQHMTLNVGVLPPQVRAISCSYPYRGSNTACHNYLFYISGIEFALGVGKQIDLVARQACFASNPFHPIIVTDYSEDIRGNFNRVWKKAKKAKNLGKHMKNLKP